MSIQKAGVRDSAGGSVSKQAPYATPHTPPTANCSNVSTSTSLFSENFDTYTMCTANSSADTSVMSVAEAHGQLGERALRATRARYRPRP